MNDKPVNPGNEDGHYSGEYQPMDFGVEFFTPVYQINQVLKYLARHHKKGKALDLKKAAVFIETLRNAEPALFIFGDRMDYTANKCGKVFSLGDIAEKDIIAHLFEWWQNPSPLTVDRALSKLHALSKVTYGESIWPDQKNR